MYVRDLFFGSGGGARINRERADRDGLGRAERIRAGPDGIRKLRVGTGRVGRAGAGTGHFCLYAVTDGSFLILRHARRVIFDFIAYPTRLF